MRWKQGRRSVNVEDRRRAGPVRAAPLGIGAHHAHRMRHILEPGDVEEALRAASAIGDDRLQRETQGYVVPDSFTHGTSEQRVRWFRRGLETGDIEQGDTFRADPL